MKKIHSAKQVFILTGVLSLLLIGMGVFSLTTGHLSISWSEISETLLGEGSRRNELLLMKFRLPRLLIAVLVGVGLSIAGALFQSVTQNELADPGIIGINSGAGLAVVLFLYFTARSSAIPLLGAISLPFAAFAGGAIAAVSIYIVAWKNGVTPIRLVLVGIGINAGFAALLTMIQLRMSDSDFNQVTVWLSGSIWNADWTAVWSTLPWIVTLTPLAFYKSRTLNLLQLGDEMATGLGISVEIERIKLIAIGVALAGACVSVAGGISFLGLGAPHIARKLVGSRHQRFLPVTACIGAIILLISDMIARNILAPSELPVGLVVAILGAPYFIYLLINSED